MAPLVRSHCNSSYTQHAVVITIVCDVTKSNDRGGAWPVRVVVVVVVVVELSSLRAAVRLLLSSLVRFDLSDDGWCGDVAWVIDWWCLHSTVTTGQSNSDSQAFTQRAALDSILAWGRFSKLLKIFVTSS